jgi:hypothetical protein
VCSAGLCLPVAVPLNSLGSEGDDSAGSRRIMSLAEIDTGHHHPWTYHPPLRDHPPSAGHCGQSERVATFILLWIEILSVVDVSQIHQCLRVIAWLAWNQIA